MVIRSARSMQRVPWIFPLVFRGRPINVKPYRFSGVLHSLDFLFSHTREFANIIAKILVRFFSGNSNRLKWPGSEGKLGPFLCPELTPLEFAAHTLKPFWSCCLLLHSTCNNVPAGQTGTAVCTGQNDNFGSSFLLPSM